MSRFKQTILPSDPPTLIVTILISMAIVAMCIFATYLLEGELTSPNLDSPDVEASPQVEEVAVTPTLVANNVPTEEATIDATPSPFCTAQVHAEGAIYEQPSRGRSAGINTDANNVAIYWRLENGLTGWWPVDTGNGRVGWIPAEYLDFGNGCENLPQKSLAELLGDDTVTVFEDLFNDNTNTWLDEENDDIPILPDAFGDWGLTLTGSLRSPIVARLRDPNPYMTSMQSLRFTSSFRRQPSSIVDNSSYSAIRFGVSADRQDYYELRLYTQNCDVELVEADRGALWRLPMIQYESDPDCAGSVEDFVSFEIVNNQIEITFNDIVIPSRTLDISRPNNEPIVGGFEMVSFKVNTTFYFLLITGK